jgi:hypothetical protein
MAVQDPGQLLCGLRNRVQVDASLAVDHDPNEAGTQFDVDELEPETFDDRRDCCLKLVAHRATSLERLLVSTTSPPCSENRSVGCPPTLL